MLYCEKCKVHIRTNHTRCPLCQGALTGEYDRHDRLFPELEETPDHYRFFLQCAAFFGILAVVICLAVNWIVTPDYWWSLFVVGGVLCTWIVIFVGVKKRRNLLKNALWELILLEAALLIWDAATGWHGWSLDYFIPLGILAALIFMLVIIITQRMASPEYMIYLLIVGIFGLIPLPLLLLDLVSVRIPSIICIGFSILLLAALVIFQKSAVIGELSRKLHI